MTPTLHKPWPHRPWAVWLALLVAVFAAIAPAVSHALVFAKGGTLPGIEICTTAGPQWVDPASGALLKPAPEQGALPTLDHCPFCLHVADHAAPPPCPPAYGFGQSAQVRQGNSQQLHHGPCAAYSPANPRGPPAKA